MSIKQKPISNLNSLLIDLVVYDEETKNKINKKIKAKKGESVLEISVRELNAKYELRPLEKEKIPYVKEIMGIPESNDYYWEYAVNGVFPKCGASKYFITGSEKIIQWIRLDKYSKQLFR
jgi:transcription elongation factor GreA-like protein